MKSCESTYQTSGTREQFCYYLSSIALKLKAESLDGEYEEKNREVEEKRSHLQQQIRVHEADISKLTTICRELKRGKLLQKGSPGTQVCIFFLNSCT
jgi:hypothetical protein